MNFTSYVILQHKVMAALLPSLCAVKLQDFFLQCTGDLNRRHSYKKVKFLCKHVKVFSINAIYDLNGIIMHAGGANAKYEARTRES